MRTVLGNYVLDLIMPHKMEMGPREMRRLLDNTFDNEGENLVEMIDTKEEREVRLFNFFRTMNALGIAIFDLDLDFFRAEGDRQFGVILLRECHDENAFVFLTLHKVSP